MKVLYLTIKREWFDKILSGEKTIEYREVKRYWHCRLIKKEQYVKFDYIIFKNGYSKNAPTIKIKHIKTERIYGYSTDLKIDKQVYAIHLGEIID